MEKMKRHFHDDLKDLKENLLRMGFLVEEGIFKATQALIEGNAAICKDVMENEKKINQLELQIDEQAQSLMAIEQPVAIDFRRLLMITKMNGDLERMGDHAVNIAERAIRSSSRPAAQFNKLPLDKMAKAALVMLRKALDSFVKEDVNLANIVLASDDEVDSYNGVIFSMIKERLEADNSAVSYGIDMALVAYNLERIADLASNIAEDVIFIKQGKEVRHPEAPTA